MRAICGARIDPGRVGVAHKEEDEVSKAGEAGGLPAVDAVISPKQEVRI